MEQVIFLYLPWILHGGIILLTLLKTGLFIKHKSPYWRFSDFLHFSRYNIYNSSSQERAVHKEHQNKLSMVLLFMVVLDLFLSFIAIKLH